MGKAPRLVTSDLQFCFTQAVTTEEKESVGTGIGPGVGSLIG